MLTHAADELRAYLHRAARGGQPEMQIRVEHLNDTTIRLLRMGKRFAVVDVAITSDGSDDEVAHAMVTYAPLLG